ncbi:unnamed protein product [Pleuronectes platessa]|uniref:C2H2-type domain-containing protein n=1 Tax=Pleuronectes platessa TaxID=8262 RepID=A0A9N7VMQ6_PLEPL|nr:unnamed protein product [Pleuronectes platessa]
MALPMDLKSPENMCYKKMPSPHRDVLRPRPSDLTLDKSRQGNYRCEICSRSFNSLQSLHRHQQYRNTERGYKCTLCCKIFEGRHDLKKHLQDHANESFHYCSHCVIVNNSDDVAGEPRRKPGGEALRSHTQHRSDFHSVLTQIIWTVLTYGRKGLGQIRPIFWSLQRMAQGWDSYLHNIPPLSSDPRTSEAEHLENFIEHDFTDSYEAPAINSNINTNPDQHQSQDQSLGGGVDENAVESIEELDRSTEEDSMLGMLYVTAPHRGAAPDPAVGNTSTSRFDCACAGIAPRLQPMQLSVLLPLPQLHDVWSPPSRAQPPFTYPRELMPLDGQMCAEPLLLLPLSPCGSTVKDIAQSPVTGNFLA